MRPERFEYELNKGKNLIESRNQEISPWINKNNIDQLRAH